jgi:hypothetical protein
VHVAPQVLDIGVLLLLFVSTECLLLNLALFLLLLQGPLLLLATPLGSLKDHLFASFLVLHKLFGEGLGGFVPLAHPV